jgi:hypothetical protein
MNVDGAAESHIPPEARPGDYVPLHDVTVDIRPGGVNVRANPNINSEHLGVLRDDDRVQALGLVFRDYTWLQIPWERNDQEAQNAWIAGEFTDFARSASYSQVIDAWYESSALLDFRRALVRDLLRVRGASQEQLMQANTLYGDSLRKLEAALAGPTMLAGYRAFWELQERLGLPDPFEVLPVHTTPPERIQSLEINGFGPSTYAFENWWIYYADTRGLHSGFDYLVPEGTPLIAVADGEIVDFHPAGSPSSDPALALRPYLPTDHRTPDGARVLSNLVVVYGHLTGDPTALLVQTGDVVRAGQIIGTSGWPVFVQADDSITVQWHNAHLLLETHLVTDGTQTLDNRMPFNPLLFWSPRLVGGWDSSAWAVSGSSRRLRRSGTIRLHASKSGRKVSIIWMVRLRCCATSRPIRWTGPVRFDGRGS